MTMSEPDIMSQPLPLLLLVDDDPLISDGLNYALAPHFDVVSSASRRETRQLLRQLRKMPEIAIVDLGLPPCPHRPDEGFALIGELLAAAPGMRILVLSGQNEDENARHARTLGALDFLAKPCEPEQLLAQLRKAMRLPGTGDTAPDSRSQLIGNSPALQKLRLQVSQYAESAYPVLIEGESGSGKEIVARHCLHQQTSRCQQPFLALNCAALSPGLVEATLFGHARGAFTGANGAQPGYFEVAGDGTLLLDEIGEMPAELQAKLLRVLENGEYQRLGETQPRRSRARILAATNRDLRSEVRNGRFRADLYHRLSVFTIAVPPLRDMNGDRLLLLDHYRLIFARENASPPCELDADAKEIWCHYHFPGNVRELRNIVIRLTAKYPGKKISADMLRDELEVDAPPLPPAPINALETLGKTAALELSQHGAIDLDARLAQWESAYIDAALELSHGNVSQASRRLGLNRSTLYNRMEAKAR